MKTRRHVLAVLGATAIAGCAGQATDQPAGNETADEPAPEGEASNDGIDDPHLDWAYGEDQQILEQVRDEVNLEPVKNILEGDAGIHRKIGESMLEANTQYTQEGEGYEHRHKYAVTALDQAIRQTNLDTRITTIADDAKTPLYPEENGLGLDYGKVWIDGEEKDINIALNPAKKQPAYHIEGEQPEGEIEETLANLRDAEVHIERGPHNYPAMQEAIEYLGNEGRDFSDEEIQSGYGSWFSRFDNYIWGEGTPVPSSVEDWKQLHQGFESGAEMVRELNRAYEEAGYNGETAQFTVEDGSVTMNDVPDDYNPAEDGIPGNPAA